MPKDQPKTATRKDLPFLLDKKAINQTTREIDFTASTAAYDRVGDSIDQNGWELGNYLKNPVVLYGHDYSGFPIGRATDIGIKNGQLVIRVQFATAEQNPDAEVAYQLALGGFLNAVSVGFIPKEWSYRNETDGRPSGMDITKAELLEVSVVPVPCHPDAIVQARGLGIVGQIEKFLKATKPDEVLTTEQQIALAKANIERNRTTKSDNPPPAETTSGAPQGGESPTPPQTTSTDTTPPQPPATTTTTADEAPPVTSEPEVKSQTLLVTLKAEELKEVVAQQIAKLQADFEAQLKAGRVLSKKNETALRDAYQMAEQTCEKIKAVLDQLEDDSQETDEPGEPPPAPDNQRAQETATLGSPQYSVKDFQHAIEQASTVAACRITGRP